MLIPIGAPALLAALLTAAPGLAGIVDTYQCRRDLAVADELMHGVRLRGERMRKDDIPGNCRLLRQNVNDMIRAREPTARCMTGHDLGENVAQIDATIGDMRYILARNCTGR